MPLIYLQVPFLKIFVKCDVLHWKNNDNCFRFQSIFSLACRCREKAYGKYQYFSLGFYGECYGASNAEVFQTRNESTACIDGSQYQCDKIVSKECVGVEDNEYVYEILQSMFSNFYFSF